MRRLCVFAGSSPGARPGYVAAARALGGELARRRIELVYGGADIGLMGALADAVLAGGGHVIGVIPEALVAREVAHGGVPDLRVVGSMHARKAEMADLADAFVALPGGFGTLEELFEVLTWAQLGVHAKPCGLLDVCGYFTPLLAMLDRAVGERFLAPAHRALVLVDGSAPALLDRLATSVVAVTDTWFDTSRT